MKNYYEILEVDKNASQEVIEKAYKALAKKYHPDLQQGAQKEEYAEKMKIINQAYEVLSDTFKREDYDEQLQSETLSQEEQEKIMQENYELKQRINKIGQQQATQQTAYNQYQQQSQQQQNVDEGTIVNMSRVLTEQIRAAQRQAYYDAYIQDMKSRGYKIRYKRGFKYYLKLIKVILIMLVICFLVYQLPPVKGYFHNLYNENMIFQAIVNIFRNTFSVKF